MPLRLPAPPTPPDFFDATRYAPPPSATAWSGAQLLGEPEGVPWGRYLDVLKRNTILILALAAVGSALGLVAVKRIKPVYDAEATIWINPGTGSNTQQVGPIRGQQLLPQTSWVELLRSFAIVEPVVRELKLNVGYEEPKDSVAFRNFQFESVFQPGSYVLLVDQARKYSLSTSKGVWLESGAVGDSVGRKLGFLWVPPAGALTPGRRIAFGVAPLRSAAVGLLGKLRSSLPDDAQFLTIGFAGPDPRRTADVVNALAGQFVLSSGDLKKRHLLEFKKILGEQVGVADGELRKAENQLEQFRISNSTLPSSGPALAPGGQHDPLTTTYFQQKEALEDVRSERVAVEQLLAGARAGALNAQAFVQLPSILNNTPQLRGAIEELSSRQATLRTEQQYLTEANPRIQQLNESIHVLERVTIPQIIRGILVSLQAKERDLDSRIQSQSEQLRAIPSRAIGEMRLVRHVAASENLYNSLKARYDEVSLAEAQTIPDLTVLDYAVAATHPNSNDGSRLFLLAVLASIGLAGAIALLRDRLDTRFRYPDEATRELGLAIAGTVPQFKPNRGGDFQIAVMSQAVESFRSLRLAVRYEFAAGSPVVFSVSSPGPGDGKSLVSSNLALAFASAGHRTLLIDGDVRRGTQHGTFDVPVVPGLVEFLEGNTSAESVTKQTASENLYVIPRGTRRTKAPELLVSEQMANLVRSARQEFEVVIIDCPPFVAGVDAYALGAAAGSMLLVLRPSLSDRKLAAAKLEILDRLPIRILGTVLNGVPSGGMYRYYGTDYAYGDTKGRDPGGSVATPRGLVLRAQTTR
jgi:capsular exopolysaccharide synthesis family protein